MLLEQLLPDISDMPSSLRAREIESITQDSRLARANSVFFAIEGTSRDGHDFVAEVLTRSAPEAPAAAVIRSTHPKAQELRNDPRLAGRLLAVMDVRQSLARAACRIYGEPSRRLLICGVTGTNGKTSCTYLLEALLTEWGMRPAVIGTIENRIGEKRLSSTHTTPDAVGLQKLLRDFLKEGATSVAMEVSSHALDQQRTGGMHFAAALFTNVTQDHLDYHGTIEEYFAAKAKLFLDYPVKVRAINNDDPYGQKLVSLCLQRGFDPLTFGRQGCNVNYGQLRLTSKGIEGNLSIVLKGKTSNLHVSSPMLGSFNAQNIAGAVAVAVGLGIPFPKISHALARAPQVPGRMESVPNDKDVTVIVDYAHTPDALENVLKTARMLCRGKLVCLFGCGGDRDSGKRPLMGAIAEKLSDQVIVTSDNPRSENPKKIIENILKGMSDGSKAIVLEDRKSAIAEAVQALRAGDVLVIAGKGHETYQIIGDRKLPFDDRAIALENLK